MSHASGCSWQDKYIAEFYNMFSLCSNVEREFFLQEGLIIALAGNTEGTFYEYVL